MGGLDRRRALPAIRLTVAVALGWIALLVLTDRPGLRVEYFAIEPLWRGAPVDTDIGLPGLESRRAAGYRLLSHELFSIRWRGWIRIEREGRHRFSLDTDERAYLQLDGRELISLDSEGKGRDTGGSRLAPGLYPLEIGMSQTGGRTWLAVSWSPPGEAVGSLPPDRLFAARPGRLREGTRRLLSPLSAPLRRMLGAGLLLVAALLLAAEGRRGIAARAERVQIDLGRAIRVGLPLALFVLVWWLVYRFTARTVDGDDIRYLHAAQFGERQAWFLNRYSHVYLVRVFNWLTGDGFLTGRHFWSFTCAATVAALTVAVGALGRGPQIRTLLVTLFLLFSQVAIWGTIGAAFADYSTMLFVTAGVAVYLTGRARETEIAWEWPALCIGSLTVLAYRSKETGIVLLWLLLLLLWCGGRVDWRRFARRAGFWLAGAAAAYLVLMSLDGLLLGDFWFSLRPESVEALQINLADRVDFSRSSGDWMDVVWQPGVEGRPRDHSLRHLGLLVVVAGFAAGLQRRRADTCLLHLMPVVFLALLIIAHVRGSFVHSPRHLLPILPTACLLAAMLFHHLGIEEPPWRKLLAPSVLAGLVSAVAVVWLIQAPFRIGELAAGSFVPAQALALYGWSPEDFVERSVGPLLVLALVTAAALAPRSRRALLAVSLLCLPFLFGTAFELTRLSLVRGGAVQRSDLILYPWDAFGEEIAAAGNRRIFVSSDVFRRYGMGGQRVNRDRIASLYFHREGMSVEEIDEPGSGAALIVVSRRELERWRREKLEIEATESYDDSGELVLLRR